MDPDVWNAPPPGRNGQTQQAQMEADFLGIAQEMNRIARNCAWKATPEQGTTASHGAQDTPAQDTPAQTMPVNEDVLRLSRALDAARAEAADLRLKVASLYGELAPFNTVPMLEGFLYRLRDQARRWRASLPSALTNRDVPEGERKHMQRLEEEIEALDVAIRGARKCSQHVLQQVALASESVLRVLANDLEHGYPGSLAACEVRAMVKDSLTTEK